MTHKKNAPVSPHANHVMELDTRSADDSARDARIQIITAVGNPRYPEAIWWGRLAGMRRADRYKWSEIDNLKSTLV